MLYLCDIEKIVKIYSEWGKFKGILPDCLTIGDSYDDLIKFFDGTNDSRRYLLAENEGNEAIGVCYIDLIFLGYNNIRLGDMMVKEKYRKMGVGGALVDKVIDYAKENNVNKIWLWTQEELTEAIRFYESNGFMLEGRQKAQFFGKDPKKFIIAVKIAKKLKFDGIDINMGCPDKKVIKQGAGADLILNPKLAKKIILSVKKEAGNLPVSVKTRIGYYQYEKKEFKKWLENLLSAKPDAIIIHGRTRKMMYAGEADWQAIKFAVEIVKNYNQKNKTDILILGNGDVKSLNDAYNKICKSGVDGVMIGRQILNNPWFFRKKEKKISFQDKKNILLKHIAFFEKQVGKNQDFNSLKKYFKSYISGFKNAKDLRIKLMMTKNIKEARGVIKNYKS